MYKEKYPHDDLENLTEEIVYQQIHHLLESDASTELTEVSLQDVAAIALNNLKPLYATSFLDKINPRDEFKKEIASVTEEAAKQVKAAVDRVMEQPHD